MATAIRRPTAAQAFAPPLLELVPAAGWLGTTAALDMLMAMVRGDGGGNDSDPPALLLPFAVMIVGAVVIAVFTTLGVSLVALFVAGVGWFASGRGAIGAGLAVARGALTLAIFAGAANGDGNTIARAIGPLFIAAVLCSLGSAIVLWALGSARVRRMLARAPAH